VNKAHHKHSKAQLKTMPFIDPANTKWFLGVNII